MDKVIKDLPDYLVNPDVGLYRNSPNYVVLDFETTNLLYGTPYEPSNSLVLTCWTVAHEGEVTHKHVVGTEFDMYELVADINAADFLVAHNAKFELGWLHRCGYDVGSKPVWCTQVAEHVISGNRQWKTSLNDCCARRGWESKDDLVSRMIKGGVCPSEIPTRWLLKYCIKDVELCHRLFRDQLQRINEYDLEAVTYCRMLLTPVLADIERYGMQMDQERVEFLHRTYSTKLAQLRARFEQFTGGVNSNSGKQMAEYLYEELKFPIPKDYSGNEMRTPKGLPMTNAEAIAKLRPANKKQTQFLELYKEISKTSDLMSKYVTKMKECCEVDDGLLRANLNQCRTQTHRLSSTGQKYAIQFQNVQRELKGVFRAKDPEWYVVEIDYSQLEYRAAVDMAGDVAGKEDIKNGVDSHGFTASIIFEEFDKVNGVDKERTKALRTAAKAHTFKPLYGGSSGTKAQQRYYAAFKQKHKEITQWQQTNVSATCRSKQLRIPSGLVFYWPDTKITQSGYVVNTTSICNYPVQSFATADIVPLGVVWTWHMMRAAGLQSYLVNTVHDSIIAEVCEEELHQYEELASYGMVNGVLSSLRSLYDYDFTTPLEVETEVCKHWVDHGKWYDNFIEDSV